MKKLLLLMFAATTIYGCNNPAHVKRFMAQLAPQSAAAVESIDYAALDAEVAANKAAAASETLSAELSDQSLLAGLTVKDSTGRSVKLPDGPDATAGDLKAIDKQLALAGDQKAVHDFDPQYPGVREKCCCFCICEGNCNCSYDGECLTKKAGRPYVWVQDPVTKAWKGYGDPSWKPAVAFNPRAQNKSQPAKAVAKPKAAACANGSCSMGGCSNGSCGVSRGWGRRGR